MLLLLYLALGVFLFTAGDCNRRKPTQTLVQNRILNPFNLNLLRQIAMLRCPHHVIQDCLRSSSFLELPYFLKRFYTCIRDDDGKAFEEIRQRWNSLNYGLQPTYRYLSLSATHHQIWRGEIWFFSRCSKFKILHFALVLLWIIKCQIKSIQRPTFPTEVIISVQPALVLSSLLLPITMTP